ISAPVFGFSYTEGAGGFADIYPLIAESKSISVTNITYGFSLNSAIGSLPGAPNATLQTVTDYGNYYDTAGTYVGPWDASVAGLAPSKWTNSANVYSDLAQYVYTVGVGTGTSTFGVAPEVSINSGWGDNYTPVSPEIGVLGNKRSTDISGYRTVTAAACGWATPSSGQCSAGNTVTVGTGGVVSYNACYALCKSQ
ncbi:hypothetical protein MBAV_000611, partial [Candidatus Magnetobacterium bavaricum]